MPVDRVNAKADKNSTKRLLPVLIGFNVVLGVGLIVALIAAFSGPESTSGTRTVSTTARSERDPLVVRADALIADLHCPCPTCGHSKLVACDSRCGERVAVRDFVLRHLRSGTNAATVLAHVKDRFGDLTTVAGAKAAWDSMHPQSGSSTSLPAEGTEELPPDLLRLLEQQQDGS
ncbi:MAG: hypothetical protein AMXMBFR13_17980 [Phycisphaerae bacterium]